MRKQGNRDEISSYNENIYLEFNKNMRLIFFFYQRQENFHTLHHQKQGNYQNQENFEDVSNQKQSNMILNNVGPKTEKPNHFRPKTIKLVDEIDQKQVNMI